MVKKVIEKKTLMRQREKGQAREMVTRRQKEKEVLEALNNNTLSEMTLDIDSEGAQFIKDVQNGKQGIAFQHVWSTSDGQDDIYCGRVGKAKTDKKGVRKVWITYCKDDISESESADYLIGIHSLFTDVILGDAFFC